MTTSPTLADLERRVLQLSHGERVWLIERLAQSLRAGPTRERPERGQELAAMAADPEIQRELHQIAGEFAATEMDGLQD